MLDLSHSRNQGHGAGGEGEEGVEEVVVVGVARKRAIRSKSLAGS